MCTDGQTGIQCTSKRLIDLGRKRKRRTQNVTRWKRTAVAPSRGTLNTRDGIPRPRSKQGTSNESTFVRETLNKQRYKSKENWYLPTPLPTAPDPCQVLRVDGKTPLSVPRKHERNPVRKSFAIQRASTWSMENQPSHLEGLLLLLNNTVSPIPHHPLPLATTSE
ncbi:unnamed protein product, partial [Ectocarpus sp. 12 AP-2014]